MLETLINTALRRAARHYRYKPFAMANAAPLVSFTFDDVPASAYTNGTAVLDERGVRGTFYVAGGTCGTMDDHWRVIEREQVRALYDAGHEIGCHTFSHVRVDRLGAVDLEEECRRNYELLRDLCPGIQLTNFCYPFGRASLPSKLRLERRFDSCRGIYEGVNSGTIDLAMLRVIELYDRTLTREKLRHVLNQTRERNGWLIFYTHDVTESPSSIGCTPELLNATIAAVQAENMQCLTVRDALATIGYANKPENVLGFNARAARGSR
jgi:peptidoglycan/xylan/chitin deacetylase (PgdA/CDA1 family)